MNLSCTGNYSIISDGYVFQTQSEVGPIYVAKEPSRIMKVWGYFLSLPARIWRLICFKVIVIMALALFSGFCSGVVFTIDTLDEVEETEGNAIELLTLDEANI